jgi:hypothetical protein
MEAVCRTLAAVLTWVGVVEFTVSLLWSYGQRTRLLDLLRQPLSEVVKHESAWSDPGASWREEVVHRQVFRHLETWLPWYYSPLNLLHGAVALVCLSPALGLYLWARYLGWHRQAGLIPTFVS